ncbi:hypothetical protein [Mucilaginibacter sp.]|uniref:hypothetical protein n=1 Tax=Mucilaginibacter sp. TaxID=1882438 RepID=UPI0025D5E200|nr:hypothetical protein [Mucilaginibacter sp.]
MKILTLTPRKPIIYPPGMISLFLLPMFCLLYLKQHKAFEGQSWMNVAMWSADFDKMLPEKYQHKFPASRNYLDINLDGNDVNDKIRLDFARLEVRRILATGDTIKGVDFHFGKTARYWTFINSLDILGTENAQMYGPYKDDIYFWYKKPQIYPKSKYGGFLANDIMILPLTSDEVSQRLWNGRIAFLNKALKDFWAPGIVFLMMLFFAMRKLVVNNRLYSTRISPNKLVNME